MTLLTVLGLWLAVSLLAAAVWATLGYRAKTRRPNHPGGPSDHP